MSAELVQTQSQQTSQQQTIDEIGNDYKYGFHDKEDYIFKSGKGLSEEIVRTISSMKNEPEWMLKFRLRALDIFNKKPMPTWGNCDLINGIDFQNIHYYVKPSERSENNWDEVPEGIKQTFDRLGIPEAERKFLAGVTAQYESEVVYHSIREDLEQQGVIFLDMDSGLREHEQIVREHFASVIPAADNKFSALNSAVWSGGSFIWVPKGVRVEIPLQAYFRINAQNMGQFERTLIIAEPGSYVHYIEGCTAPTYTTDSLHSAVVELIAKPGSHIRYTTIQNWSKNVYNLVTKRAVAHEGAKVEWVDGNLGSKLTMKYPAIYLLGPKAHGEVLSIAFAGEDQHQDAGAKMVHAAPDTTSIIVSKSISKNGGRTSYRGLVKVYPGAENVKSSVKCDALLMDEKSRSDTYPTMEIDEKNVTIEHEATVSKVGEEQLFYLMSRGLTQDEATAMIVNGFFEPFVKELPLEYAVELNRLIQMEMTGSVG
ncbi:MAG: Fe-S cluster assembly protein SufB [Candidatus Obscuribacterales bacterium]|nr:Fe-S cluster assembly protein SufB [Candidatus Obscuribacterales bacterium]